MRGGASEAPRPACLPGSRAAAGFRGYAGSSAPIPKFASPRGTLSSELRNHKVH